MPDLNVLLFLTLALAGFITAYLYQADEYIADRTDPVSQPRKFPTSKVHRLSRHPATIDQPAIRGFASTFFDIPDTQDSRSSAKSGVEMDFIAGILSDSSFEENSACDYCA